MMVVDEHRAMKLSWRCGHPAGCKPVTQSMHRRRLAVLFGIMSRQPGMVDVVVLVVSEDCMVALSLINVMRQQCNRVELKELQLC